MRQYLDLLEDIKDNGVKRHTRQGTDVWGVFGRQMLCDLNEGFPLLTTKKMFLRGIIHELLWFLQGNSNIEYLVKNDVHIWDEWPYRAYLEKQGMAVPESSSEEWLAGIKEFAERIKTDHAFALKHGELGPVYGYQWRHWPDGSGGEIDQIQRAIDT